MITHIDVGVVLRRTVSELYSTLVTRPTGAAVRGEIEELISTSSDGGLAVIDFGGVSLLDFSCADEVVAKLVIKFCDVGAPSDAYFLFRGINDSHREAIEGVLERRSVAIVTVLEDGDLAIVGPLSDSERSAWTTVQARRRLRVSEVAGAMQSGGNDHLAALDGLCARRLLRRNDDEYLSLGEMLS